jgi:hypothetical protein
MCTTKQKYYKAKIAMHAVSTVGALVKVVLGTSKKLVVGPSTSIDPQGNKNTNSSGQISEVNILY